LTAKKEQLARVLRDTFSQHIVSVTEALDEITLVIRVDGLVEVMTALRDLPELHFEQLIDLCGVDYSTFGGRAAVSDHYGRFAVVFHLLSVTHNQRLRVRVFASDDDMPVVDSVSGVWPSANWFEREAFDLFGIIFSGHPDLRRILTDYGFIGHPFRKDFPLSGNVEMRYDPDQQRVIYQPVSIEPRETVPRVVREANYGSVD
jgi:NADH-quinone oxidoreductase subunit C